MKDLFGNVERSKIVILQVLDENRGLFMILSRFLHVQQWLPIITETSKIQCRTENKIRGAPLYTTCDFPWHFNQNPIHYYFTIYRVWTSIVIVN